MISAALRERFDLWLHLVIYEVRKSFAGTALGYLWTVGEPILLLASYFFLFVVVFDVGHGQTPLEKVIVMFAGLVPWLYFSNTISRGMSLLATHANLVKQINFPIGLLPFVVVAQVSVELLISLALLLGLAWTAGYLAAANLLLVPATLLFALFLAAASTIASCYTVMLPDLQKFLPTILRIGSFVTPALYVPAALAENLRWIAYANPISYFISPFRWAVLQDDGVLLLGVWQDFAVAAGVTAVAVAVALPHRAYVRNVVVDYL